MTELQPEQETENQESSESTEPEAAEDKVVVEPISYTQEVYRKMIHLSALIIPIGYTFVDQWVMVAILAPLTLLTVFMDYLRHHSPAVQQATGWAFGKMLREHEVDGGGKRLSGASFVLLAACACVLFFPKIIAISAFAVLVISDTAAALIGRKWGKAKLLDKTVEGTLAFVVSGIAVIIVVGLIGHSYAPIPMEFYLFGSIGVIIGAMVEVAANRWHIDDNIAIPLVVGGTMLVLGMLLPQSYITL